MKLQNEDDELLLLCSFRYGLEKQGAIPAFVIRNFIILWKSLSRETQSTIHTEINRAITRRRLNSTDAFLWKRLLNLPAVERAPKK